MKIFSEIVNENKNWRREYTNLYTKPSQVPEEKKTYSSAVEKELMKRLEPLIKALKLDVKSIHPGWEYLNYTPDKSRIGIYGTVYMMVEIWVIKRLGKNGEHFVQFLCKEDAEESLKKIQEIQRLGFTDKYMEVKNIGLEKTNLSEFDRLIQHKEIDFDWRSVADFSEQCFYEEGPDWEKFKKENRGFFANKKFTGAR
jgi:hypothetical protein